LSTLKKYAYFVCHYYDIKGYSKVVGPLFELTKKDVVFVWNQECQRAFDDLKKALVQALVLVRPNFQEPFCLDVD